MSGLLARPRHSLNRASAEWEEAAPSPEKVGFCLTTPMQPGAPSAAKAELEQDPTRVGSLPPGFAQLGEAALSPASLDLGLATPLPPGAPSDVKAESGQDPPRWAPCPTRASTGERLHPPPATLGFDTATPLQPGAPSAAQADSGQDPTRVGSLPWTRASPGGGGRLNPPLLCSASARQRQYSLERL